MKKTTVGKQRKVTIGLDLGGRWHTYCVLDGCGEVTEQGSMASDRGALGATAYRHPGSTAIMEAGMQSPWVRRCLQAQGMKVVAANPHREMNFTYPLTAFSWKSEPVGSPKPLSAAG